MLFIIKTIKGACDIRDAFRGKVKIYDGGFYISMPKEPADGIYIGALGKHMSGKGVTKGMNTAASYYTRFFFALRKIIWAPEELMWVFRL